MTNTTIACGRLVASEVNVIEYSLVAAFILTHRVGVCATNTTIACGRLVASEVNVIEYSLVAAFILTHRVGVGVGVGATSMHIC